MRSNCSIFPFHPRLCRKNLSHFPLLFQLRQRTSWHHSLPPPVRILFLFEIHQQSSCSQAKVGYKMLAGILDLVNAKLSDLFWVAFLASYFLSCNPQSVAMNKGIT